MPLIFASAGEEVTVKDVQGSHEVKLHLNEIGFTEGSKISVIQKVATGLIVKVKDARVALDKSMAAKIII